MHIIGIDEAGRGALAGPVVVAAVRIPKGFYPRLRNLPKLKDSKGLSPIQRNVWFEYIRQHPDIFYTTARVYQRCIEQNNVAKSANLAASRTLENFKRDLGKATKNSSILLDGSLYLGLQKHKELPAKTIIRGDQRIVAIKLASIVAKVTRDNYMIRLHKKYPSYNFHLHKGYGTAMHASMIKKHGLSKVHRLTFVQKLIQ
jgi:ribonuclease HII